MYKVTIFGVEYVAPLSLWCSTLPPIFALVVLLASPWLRLPSQSIPVFLDMLCIHQEDLNLKMAGIRSLAGFLAHSESLLVLWSDQYFTRLWCVFEIAAFRRYQPQGSVIMLPICFAVTHLVGVVMWWVVMVCYNFLIVVTDLPSAYIFIVTALATFLPAGVLQLFLRRMMRNKLSLKTQLLSFDCREAACQDAVDRECIMASIVSWFGSEDAFNEYVSGTMREDVEKDMFASPID